MTQVIDIDADQQDADWTKTSWDLPPYKSPEFFQVMGADLDLAWFRSTETYTRAVDAGLIHDDEWVDSFLQDSNPRSKGRVIIHYHKD